MKRLFMFSNALGVNDWDNLIPVFSVFADRPTNSKLTNLGRQLKPKRSRLNDGFT
jgi:hypothetical protein